jgi:hypothetical protein
MKDATRVVSHPAQSLLRAAQELDAMPEPGADYAKRRQAIRLAAISLLNEDGVHPSTVVLISYLLGSGGISVLRKERAAWPLAAACRLAAWFEAVHPDATRNDIARILAFKLTGRCSNYLNYRNQARDLRADPDYGWMVATYMLDPPGRVRNTI